MLNFDFESLLELMQTKEPKVSKLKSIEITEVSFILDNDMLDQYQLVKWALENNKLENDGKFLEVICDDVEFTLIFPSQIRNFFLSYKGQDALYLKVNGKNFYEIALTKKDIIAVKKSILKKSKKLNSKKL